MKILVTGSSGFIGRYLIQELGKTDHDVTPFDISDGNDVLDYEKLTKLEKFDIIIHLANKIFVPDSFKDPANFYKINFQGTLNLLELCRVHKSKFIYLSSYVYGQPEYFPIDEKHPVQAHNPYAHSKIIAEQLCKSYFSDFKVPVTILRPFNIYGIGQHPDLLFSSILRQATEGEIVVRDTRPKRDYIHVKDVIRAILLSIRENRNSLDIYNLGTGKTFSVEEIIQLIIQLSDHKITFKSTNEHRPNEVLDTPADIKKIKTELNWSPLITLEKGLQEMIKDWGK